jgi:ribosome-associated toxin RatA of RatAB toxin-antitoxin module
VYVPAFLPLLLVAQIAAEPTPAALPTAPCIGCRADLAQVRSSYTPAEWQELMEGKVVTRQIGSSRSGSGVQSTKEASAVIPYLPTSVWSVVVDFESRPRYVPGNKEERILRREGNRLWIAEHLRILLMNIRFVVITTLEPEQGLVTWVLDHTAESDIADTTGSWTVLPLKDGQETLVRYRVSIDSGRSVPRFIENFLTERSLPKIVEGLRDEVHRRFPLLRAAPLEEPPDD